MTGESCGGSTSRVVSIAKLHGCYQATIESENVHDLTLKQYLTLKIPHELVYLHLPLTICVLIDSKWLNGGIELTPLSRPVTADLIFADHLATL